VTLREDLTELRDDVKLLLGKAGVTDARLADLKVEFEREQEGSRRYRSAMYEQINMLNSSVRDLKRDVEPVMETFEEYTRRKYEERGASRMLKLMWGVLLAVAGFVGWLIGEAHNWWPPK
jgi:hypothetical protein